MNTYLCGTCSNIHEGEPLPKKCPYCGMPASHFKLLSEEEIKEITVKNKKSMVDVTGNSIAMRGYKPSGYSRTLF